MTRAADDWLRAPGQGSYARQETERRFLVTGTVEATGDARLIEDRYLEGTGLRVRRMTAGASSVYKLTQKVRADPADPASVSLTNMYLSVEEYERLRALPGWDLTKTRRAVAGGPEPFVVDEFAGALSGLVLAEVEVGTLQDPLDLPSWIGAEVTSDDRFSGGRLARADPDEIATVLRAMTDPKIARTARTPAVVAGSTDSESDAASERLM